MYTNVIVKNLIFHLNNLFTYIIFVKGRVWLLKYIFLKPRRDERFPSFKIKIEHKFLNEIVLFNYLIIVK